MANTYDVGDLIRISGSFDNSAGVAIDPATVTLEIKAPTGTVSTCTYVGEDITKDAVGRYHGDVDITVSGAWHYRWSSTGTGQAAGEDHFIIRRQEVS